jgi:opacity protein-like surface antigen
MKTFPLAIAAWVMGAAVAVAQEPARPPLTRADVQVVVGWQNLRREQPQQSYNDNWMNGIFYGGGGAGWYWTDHLKTRVDFGAGTEGHQYRYEPIVVNGQTSASSSRLSVQRQSVAVAQQYQFFRNQWFHPYVGAGLDIARETTIESYDPVFVFDSVTRVSRQLTPAQTRGPDHRMVARPFAETGFKAYMTRRAFFTGDMRVAFRHGVDETLFRCGFGVDF